MANLTVRNVHLACLAALAGCSVGPDYRRPEIETPATFRFQDGEAAALADTAWWHGLGDPVLDSLIDEALANNQDLRVATANVEQFAGALTTTRAELFPQIGYGADASKTRYTESNGLGAIPGFPNPQKSYAATLNATWELDLWGRIRRTSEAAQAELFAAESARRGVVLSLVAAVASGYVDLRGLDAQLDVAKRTADTRKQALDLFELRFGGGVVSQVEVAQARSEYESAAAAIPTIERAIAKTEDALSVLLGRDPGPIERGKSIEELEPVPVPSGLPSDLLERRPDVQRAEQRLIAANARIGAARALYFPTISLTGFFGYASGDLSSLFDGASREWTYSGSIAGPLFTFGQVAGQVQQAEAEKRQLVAEYRACDPERVPRGRRRADRRSQVSRGAVGAQSRTRRVTGLCPARPPPLRQRLHQLPRSPRRPAQRVRRRADLRAEPGGGARRPDLDLQGDGRRLGRHRRQAHDRARSCRGHRERLAPRLLNSRRPRAVNAPRASDGACSRAGRARATSAAARLPRCANRGAGRSRRTRARRRGAT